MAILKMAWCNAKQYVYYVIRYPFVCDQGKNESLRARAILRSLVPLEDLQGVLSLRFTLTNPAAGEERPKSDMPSGLIPGNKQSVVLFLERVYGIETQELFYKLLEDAFLPDLRAATMLDRVSKKTIQ